MVFGDRPLIVEEKVPVPEPSVVLVASATVGFALVLHTTPRAVTVDPPSAVTLPPEAAPVVVMDDAVVVDTVGKVKVVNVSDVP